MTKTPGLSDHWTKHPALVEAQRKRDMATIGEQRVRTTFNPSANSVVDLIKQKSAELIDICEKMKGQISGSADPQEIMRLLALAQTHYEDAAMWAVKAATA